MWTLLKILAAFLVLGAGGSSSKEEKPALPGKDPDKPEEKKEPRKFLKVMSWNIQGGCGAPTNEGVYGLERQIDYIKEKSCDLVFIQEAVDPTFRCPCDKPRTELLRSVAGYNTIRDSASACMILVKQGIDFNNVKLHAPKIISATIEAHGKKISVICAHAPRTTDGRQIEYLAKLDEVVQETAVRLPVILGGDLNTEYYTDLNGKTGKDTFFDDLAHYALPSNVATFPTLDNISEKNKKSLRESSIDGKIAERLDYILITKDLGYQNLKVDKEAAALSDHWPVYAEIAI